MDWIDRLRLTLLITLSLLFLAMLYKRFKRRVMLAQRPVPLHAELIALQMEYHPDRLRVEITLPRAEEIRPSMLDTHHRPLRHWPSTKRAQGHHVLELPMGEAPNGEYYFELATASQRTVRKFILRRA